MLTVITGPPCSGKSTHARAHASDGAIVVDLDDLARALGSASSHDHSPAVLRVARAARHAAIAAAVREHARGGEVWVVDAAPSAGRREQYAAAGAVYVQLDVARAELHRRATDTGRPAWVHRQIDRWSGTEVGQAPATSRSW